MGMLVEILYVISFLDALCFGLIMPVLPTHILNLGGNHTTLGVLGMLHMLLQLFAVPLAKSYSHKYGKKRLLMMTQFIGMLSNILMGIVTKYISVILIRLIFYLTNQTLTFCKAFIADFEVKDKHNAIYSKMNLLGVFGFIIGPIIGGYLFNMEYGFYYISVVTFILAQISIMLTLLLPNDRLMSPGNRTAKLAEKIAENLGRSLQCLQNLQIRNHWHIVLIKIYTTVSLTVFFMKFSLLLKILHGQNSIGIGYTVAYQSILIFISNLLLPIIDTMYNGQHIKKLSHSLGLLVISMANVCYAPSYTMYLICFIPLGMAKCVFDSAFRDITKSKAMSNLSGGLDTITTLFSIVTPPVFGYFCDFYTHNAVKGFSIIPLIFTMFLLHFSTIAKIK